MRTDAERFFKIEEGLYQGSRPGLYPPSEIDVVVNVSDERNDFVECPELFAILHFPLVDFDFPGLSWLHQVTDVIHLCRKAGQSVLVHCSRGESRSSMVVLAYLMKHRGMSLWDAIKFLEKQNPWADPNHRFIAGLEQFEVAIQKELS